MDLERLKILYPEEWEKCRSMKDADKVFAKLMKVVLAKQKLENELDKEYEKRRKKQTTALVLLAKLLTKNSIGAEVIIAKNYKYFEKDGINYIDYLNEVFTSEQIEEIKKKAEFYMNQNPA